MPLALLAATSATSWRPVSSLTQTVARLHRSDGGGLLGSFGEWNLQSGAPDGGMARSPFISRMSLTSFGSTPIMCGAAHRSQGFSYRFAARVWTWFSWRSGPRLSWESSTSTRQLETSSWNRICRRRSEQNLRFAIEPTSTRCLLPTSLKCQPSMLA